MRFPTRLLFVLPLLLAACDGPPTKAPTGTPAPASPTTVAPIPSVKEPKKDAFSLRERILLGVYKAEFFRDHPHNLALDADANACIEAIEDLESMGLIRYVGRRQLPPGTTFSPAEYRRYTAEIDMAYRELYPRARRFVEAKGSRPGFLSEWSRDKD